MCLDAVVRCVYSSGGGAGGRTRGGEEHGSVNAASPGWALQWVMQCSWMICSIYILREPVVYFTFDVHNWPCCLWSHNSAFFFFCRSQILQFWNCKLQVWIWSVVCIQSFLPWPDFCCKQTKCILFVWAVRSFTFTAADQKVICWEHLSSFLIIRPIWILLSMRFTCVSAYVHCFQQ